MADLFAAACSIAPTRRRRFFWAAWWTAPPCREPFRKPDASSGGARTREEALREAEEASGRPLALLDGSWARAWSRWLVGERPWTTRQAPGGAQEHAPQPAKAPRIASAWQVLGLAPGASPEDIKRAFRRLALETHPDHLGGDGEAFRAVQRAYERALASAARPRRRARR